MKRLRFTQFWLFLLLAWAMPVWAVPPQPGLDIVTQPGPTTTSFTIEDGKAYRFGWRQQDTFLNVRINLEITGTYRAYLLMVGSPVSSPASLLDTQDGPPAHGNSLFKVDKLDSGEYDVVVVRRVTTATTATTWDASTTPALAGATAVPGVLTSGTSTSTEKPYQANFVFQALPDGARPRYAITAQWTHDPSVAYGPTSWGLVGPPAATCGFVNGFGTFRFGLAQSPINISGSQYDGRRTLSFNYPATGLPYVIENTGNTIEVPADAGFYLTYNGDRYTLLQFHVHAPSEHTLDGQSYDMEVHLVHQNALGQLAVVGVLFKSGATANSTGIDKMIEGAPASVGETHKADPNKIKVNFVPQGNFYFYSGSLTTPPCTEGVLWIVSASTTQTVATATLTTLHDLIKKFPSYGNYANNNRPVVTGQNPRPVYRLSQ